MRFGDFIKRFLGITKRRDRILTNINPDLEESKKIREAMSALSSRDAQISDLKLKEKEREDARNEFLDELSLIKELKEKSDVLENKKFNGHFEISKIYDFLKKYKKTKIEITDRDDIRVFDTFKTFVILPDGKSFGIKGMSGEIWAYGQTINHIIYKPESIKNHLRRKRIPIPYDSEHRPAPDLDKFVMRELKYYPEEDEFAESDELLRPVREMIMGRERRIYEQDKHIEYLEKLNAVQHRNLRKIQRDLNILKEKSGLENSELSIALNGLTEYARQMGNIARQNILLTEGKLTLDEVKDRQDEVINKLIGEMEDEKSKNLLRRARDEWQRDFQFAEKFGRKTYNITQEEAREIPVKPGQPIGK